MIEINMRTTLAIDDDLLAQAQALTGILQKPILVREGLKSLIEKESSFRLAKLGGSEPQLTDIKRR
jgi:Arc/MetJ family transcription regulator